jgi:lipid II:glycine glycyltransferase (peptidoglycan interpeptide bridge formation enzyme)
MNWCCHNGYKVFDFGGAGIPGKEYGVREFKKQFGGKLVNYGRFEKIYRPAIKKIIFFGLKMHQKI